MRTGRTVGVSALPGQMIASRRVTLRARSSRSACKSWNICKLMSYQRAATGVLCEAVEKPIWVLGGATCDCSHPSASAPWYRGSTSTPSHSFDPCLKLTAPQASYSPWIPIIVSRIKTLSAKIFSASLIWCIPSPCEDRYSRHSKERELQELLAKMQVMFPNPVQQVRGLKTVHASAQHHGYHVALCTSPSLTCCCMKSFSAMLGNISMHITGQHYTGSHNQHFPQDIRYSHANCISFHSVHSCRHILASYSVKSVKAHIIWFFKYFLLINKTS